MLHQFIREEEEAMITALKEEEEEKTKKTKEKITEFDKILSHIVGKIKSIEDYIRGDEHFFLKVRVLLCDQAYYTLSGFKVGDVDVFCNKSYVFFISES